MYNVMNPELAAALRTGPASKALTEWLEKERASAYTALAAAADTVTIYRLQGDLARLNSLISRTTNP